MTRKFAAAKRAQELSRFKARSSSGTKFIPTADLTANYGGQWVALRAGAVIDHDMAVEKLLARLDATGAASGDYALHLVPAPARYLLTA